MKQISRLSIQRMIDTSGSAGSGGGGGNDISLAGYATEAWVEENYLSKEFFLRLFGIHGTDENDDPVDVEPNDPDTTITDIEAKYGFWSDSFVSAFGLGEGGGGGTVTLNEPLNRINTDLNNANPTSSNRTLVWNGSKWTYKALTDGSVTSVGMSVPTGFSVTGSPITSSGTLAISFATGYSLPLTADVEKGVTAYGWGDHANAGYALASNVYSKADADGRFLTISFFRSLFKVYQSDNTTEVVPNNGETSLISSIKAMFGLWTEQYLSAFGLGMSGGGTVSLCAPLNNINNYINQNPAVNGATFVWNNTTGKFVYSNVDGQKLYVGRGGLEIGNSGNLTVSGSATVTGNVTVIGGGFVKSGSSNDYVLLAGGGTKLLSEIGGGSYLPLSGGTLSGTSSSILSIDRNSNNPTWVRFLSNETVRGFIGVSSSNEMVFNNGTTTYNVWHSGNFTPSDYALASSVYTKTEADGYFMRISGYTNIQSRATSDAHYSLNNLTDEGTYGISNNTNAAYFDDRPVTSSTAFRVVVFRTRNNTSYLCQEYQQSNSTAVYQRYTSSGSFANSTWYLVQSNLANYALASELSNYALSANVYSKTDVNGFTWWGASLSNGAVSGDMTNVGDITLSKGGNNRQLSITKSGSILLKASTSGWTASYCAKTNNGQTTLGGFGFFGSADTLVRMYIGTSYTDTWVSVLPSGNVGIGVDSPSSKLHVDGTFNATGNSTIGGTLGVTGTTTLQDNVYISNNKYIYCKTTADANAQALGLSSSNNLLFGSNANNTYITGTTVRLRYGSDNTVGLLLNSSGNVSIGSTTTSFITEKLNVDGNIKTATGDGAYIQIGGARIVWDNTNKALKVIQSDNSTAANLYATGAVSAFGIGSSASGLSLCTPLNNINSNISANPTVNGATFVWNDTTSKFVYSNASGQTLNAYNISVSSALSAYTGSFGSTLEAVNMTVTGGNLTVQTGNLTVSAGRAGIAGATSSSYTLYVHGNIRSNYLAIGATETVNSLSCATIKTLSSRGLAVQTNGNAACYTNVAWSVSSDIRLKHIVSNAGASIEQIADAPIFNFRWLSGGNDTILGSSAQYWQAVFPCAVRGDMNSFLSMDYGGIALAAAVVTARKVVKHEDEIVELKRRVKELEDELNELKAA